MDGDISGISEIVVRIASESSGLEVSVPGEPWVGALVSERKHGSHFVDSDIPSSNMDSLVFIAPASKKGVSIHVYDKCVNGLCKCKHIIGSDVSQLKPCRFASLLFGNGRVPTDDEIIMYNGIVDGFDIVSNDVDSYDNHNYLSILSEDSKSKMDKIVRNELDSGILEVVDEKPKCIHSLGAVSKPDGGIRPITDCSLPVGICINDNMDGLTKNFSFKSVDNVVQKMNEGDYITVVDIKSAYRAVSVNPEHSKLQGLRWEIDGEEKFLQDKRLCFGLRCAPFYFFLISEFVYNILTDRYSLSVVNYLDDFAAISPSYQEGLFAQTCIVNLLRYLGFYISWAKILPPSQTATFLGIIIDTVLLELRLPEGKLAKTIAMLNKINGCESISRKNLEKLTGLLGHCSTVVRGGRTFCRRLYNLHKMCLKNHLKIVRLNSESRDDIAWWLSFLRVFNGKAAVKKATYHESMISDSSLRGYAVYLGEDWVYGGWSDEPLFNSECEHRSGATPSLSDEDCKNINVLELWPVVVGICRWGDQIRGHELNVVVDNMQVFHMIRTGRSINSRCMEWLRSLFWMCVNLDVDLNPVYIRSEDNLLADTLSRVLYSKTSSKLTDLIENYSICCKKGLLCYFRLNVGATHQEEETVSEEICSTVYVES